MYAHKLVLCVWSTVFRQKITQQLEKQKKGGSNSDKLPLEVEVEERERDLFPLVMRYMYTGETDFVDGKNVLPLLDLSNRLGIEALKEVCGELLGPLVDDETLMYLLELVERYRVHSLEHACGLHLAEHFDELLMDGRAQDLPPSLWAAMLSSDDLKMISEEDIFEAVLNYAKSKFKDKKQRDQ
ncbi:Kelch-like, partial [Balamuthia mandrillaris]